MSKILLTIALYHDGPSRRPQFIVSTNNLYGIQMRGTDFKTVKIGNPNLASGNGFRHRFEYSVSGGKAVTRLSLVINTTAVLPHMTWASPHPSGPPTAKGPRGKGEDDRRVSRHSHSRHSPSGRSHNRATNHRRRHHAIDDGNVEAGDDGGFDAGDAGGDDGGGY